MNKKDMVNNFSGYYLNNASNIFQNENKPNTILCIWVFEDPFQLDDNLNILAGKAIQTIPRDSLQQQFNRGASQEINKNQLIYSSIMQYTMKWNAFTNYYEVKVPDMNDRSIHTFNYDGSNIFYADAFETNTKNFKEPGSGFTGGYILYKMLPLNPKNNDYSNYLFNEDNCVSINKLFNLSKDITNSLLILFRTNKIGTPLPEVWLDNPTQCAKRSSVLYQGLLNFIIDLIPSYIEVKNNIQINTQNILKSIKQKYNL